MSVLLTFSLALSYAGAFEEAFLFAADPYPTVLLGDLWTIRESLSRASGVPSWHGLYQV